MEVGDALKALSARKPCACDLGDDHGSAGGQTLDATPEGQVIDLSAGTNVAPAAEPPAQPTDEQRHEIGGREVSGDEDSLHDEKQRRQQEEEQQQRQEEQRRKLREALQSLTAAEVAKAFSAAQEGRVIAYRNFDEGLGLLLSPPVRGEQDEEEGGSGGGQGGENSGLGGMAGYAALCGETTAAFAALSDSINAIRDTLRDTHGRTAMADIVTKVQKLEERKLLLSTALHLETIRRHQRMSPTTATESSSSSSSSSGGGGGGEQDGSTVDLLMGAEVAQLRLQIGGVVEQINEQLEEFRYEVCEL